MASCAAVDVVRQDADRLAPALRRIALLAGVAFALAAPAASSAASAKSAVVHVVKTYQQALLNGNGKRACAQLTGGGKAKLLQALPNSAHSCTRAADELAAMITPDTRRSIQRSRRHLSTGDVHVRGRHASAKLLSGRKLLLAKVGGRWLISDPNLRV